MTKRTCADCPRVISPGAVARCWSCTGRHNAHAARNARVAGYLDLIEMGVPPGEAGRRAGVTPRTVQRWRKEGLVP